MAVYTSFIKLWPYDKSFSLRHYTFGLIDGGVISSFFNSLKMALLTAFFGTILIFGGAYLLEKTRGMPVHSRADPHARRHPDGVSRAWCWASATSFSSTIRTIRSTASITA